MDEATGGDVLQLVDRGRRAPNARAPCSGVHRPWRAGATRAAPRSHEGVLLGRYRSRASVRTALGGRGGSARAAGYRALLTLGLALQCAGYEAAAGFRRESGFGPTDGGVGTDQCTSSSNWPAHPAATTAVARGRAGVRQPGSRAASARTRRDSPRRPSARSHDTRTPVTSSATSRIISSTSGPEVLISPPTASTGTLSLPLRASTARLSAASRSKAGRPRSRPASRQGRSTPRRRPRGRPHRSPTDRTARQEDLEVLPFATRREHLRDIARASNAKCQTAGRRAGGRRRRCRAAVRPPRRGARPRPGTPAHSIRHHQPDVVPNQHDRALELEVAAQ